jgi:hypothetical protein
MSDELQKKIDELESTIKYQNKLLEEIDLLRQPRISKFQNEDGSLDIAVAGPAVELMVMLLGEYFLAGGAENYLEFVLNDKEGGQYAITMQKVDGLTPHELMLQRKSKYESMTDF